MHNAHVQCIFMYIVHTIIVHCIFKYIFDTLFHFELFNSRFLRYTVRYSYRILPNLLNQNMRNKVSLSVPYCPLFTVTIIVLLKLNGIFKR